MKDHCGQQAADLFFLGTAFTRGNLLEQRTSGLQVSNAITMEAGTRAFFFCFCGNDSSGFVAAVIGVFLSLIPERVLHAKRKSGGDRRGEADFNRRTLDTLGAER